MWILSAIVSPYLSTHSPHTHQKHLTRFFCRWCWSSHIRCRILFCDIKDICSLKIKLRYNVPISALPRNFCHLNIGSNILIYQTVFTCFGALEDTSGCHSLSSWVSIGTKFRKKAAVVKPAVIFLPVSKSVWLIDLVSVVQSAPCCLRQGTAKDGASAGQPTDYPADPLHGGKSSSVSPQYAVFSYTCLGGKEKHLSEIFFADALGSCHSF